MMKKMRKPLNEKASVKGGLQKGTEQLDRIPGLEGVTTAECESKEYTPSLVPQETVAVTGFSKGCRDMKQPQAADVLVEQSAACDASSAVGNACADRLVPFNSLPLLTAEEDSVVKHQPLLGGSGSDDGCTTGDVSRAAVLKCEDTPGVEIYELWLWCYYA